MSDELLQVYGIGNPRVKYQVVNSLGERAATDALLQIVQSEADRALRDTAIVTLGQAGGRKQLQRLYARGRPEWKRPIIVGLFNARAEDELIQIADRETDVAIRREVLARLRLLGTPKAQAVPPESAGKQVTSRKRLRIRESAGGGHGRLNHSGTASCRGRLPLAPGSQAFRPAEGLAC